VKYTSLAGLTALLALLVACSSAATGSSGGTSSGDTPPPGTPPGTPPGVPPGTSGAVPPGGPDASTDGGFDFTFSASSANNSITEIKVAPVYGAQCLGSTPNLSCSFVGNVNANGCTGILGAAFVGTPTVGMNYPIVVDPTTPPGSAEVSYTEVCGQVQKLWKATGGTLKLDAYTPASGGTGKASFTVTGAKMEPLSGNPGTATGSFSVDGKASNVQYSGSAN
jgi:hypothetical protein